MALCWNDVPLDSLLAAIEPYDKVLVAGIRKRQARGMPHDKEFLQRRLARACNRLKLDPKDLFHPHPEPARLGQSGIHVGTTIPGSGEFFYGQDEIATSILFLGSPRSGKTVAVRHVIKEAQRQGLGVLIADLRGDYLSLGQEVPRALVIPASEDRLNVLEPPSCMPLEKWLHVVASRLTYDLGLQLASANYLIERFTELLLRCSLAGVKPTLLDFHSLLARQKPKFRSSEEGYLDRTLGRIKTLIDVCGAQVFGCEKGYPIAHLLESGRLVIIDMKTDKVVADFLTSMRLYYLYQMRLHSPNPFHQKPILIVLDEQRSLIRKQQVQDFIPDIELLFSRSRALGLGFLIAEQVPSAVSPAVLTSCRLRLGFNTSPPEAFVVARLLGLNQQQEAELHKLPVGQCIARLAGDRIPGPFRLQIPFASWDVKDGRRFARCHCAVP